MTFSPKVRAEWAATLDSITHVDGTARVQTVTREQNPLLYELLTEMQRQTGIGVLINTSFNLAGKPILNTYRDAIWMLNNTEMDGLILEEFYIKKS
jgi:carbamoyltransferase